MMAEIPIRNEGDAKLYYNSLLKGLTFNSKEKINQLSQIAENNSIYADIIADVIYKHLKETIPGQKLPMLYLIDSIIKNVGGIYKRLFEEYIVEIFILVFESGTGDIKTSLFKLRNTWKNVINERELAKLDRLVNERDSHWPIQSRSENNRVYYVNPAIFPKVDKEPSKIVIPAIPPPILEPNTESGSSQQLSFDPEKQKKPFKKILDNLNSSVPVPIKKRKILEGVRKFKVEMKENNVRENAVHPQPPVQITNNEEMDTSKPEEIKDVIDALDTESLKTIIKTVTEPPILKKQSHPPNVVIPHNHPNNDRPPVPHFRHERPPRPQPMEVRPHPIHRPNFPHPRPLPHPRPPYSRPPYHPRGQHEPMRMHNQDPRHINSRKLNRSPRQEPMHVQPYHHPRPMPPRPQLFEHPRPIHRPGNDQMRHPPPLSLPRPRLPVNSPLELAEDQQFRVVEQEIPKLEMKMECLFERINVIVQHVHRGEQCTSCGLRFDKNSSYYKIHLDWHYNVNRYKPKSTHWYLPDNDWINYVENPKEVLSDVFEKEKREKWIRDKKEEEEKANVVLRDSELVQRCRICRDMLEMYFDQENEEWCCKDAVRLGYKVVVHKECAKDYKGGPFDMTPTPLGEKSLGKEGLFLSPETPSRKIGSISNDFLTSEHFNFIKNILESTKEDGAKIQADNQNFPVFNPDRIDLDDSDSEDAGKMLIDPKDEITDLEKKSELNGASVLPDDKETCSVCGDQLSSFYSDNQDKWYWKDAIRTEGTLSHCKCLEGRNSENSVDMKSPSVESDRSMETANTEANLADLDQMEDKEEKPEVSDGISSVETHVIQVYPTPQDLASQTSGSDVQSEQSVDRSEDNTNEFNSI